MARYEANADFERDYYKRRKLFFFFFFFFFFQDKVYSIGAMIYNTRKDLLGLRIYIYIKQERKKLQKQYSLLGQVKTVQQVDVRLAKLVSCSWKRRRSQYNLFST